MQHKWSVAQREMFLQATSVTPWDVFEANTASVQRHRHRQIKLDQFDLFKTIQTSTCLMLGGGGGILPGGLSRLQNNTKQHRGVTRWHGNAALTTRVRACRLEP